jgi:hypothetical protein
MQIRIKNVRISFPALAEPEAFGDGEPAYQAKFIIPPKSEQAKAIKDAIAAAAKEQWKDKAPEVLKMLVEDKKIAFVEAPYRNKKSGETYAGFEGMHYLSARNAKSRPTVYNKANVKLDDTRDIKSLIYSGCYVHALVDIWAQDNKWGRRINCTLQGVMFANDGENFGGSSVATDSAFADLASAEEDLV